MLKKGAEIWSLEIIYFIYSWATKAIKPLASSQFLQTSFLLILFFNDFFCREIFSKTAKN